MAPVRCLVLWFPDWPVTALRRERGWRGAHRERIRGVGGRLRPGASDVRDRAAPAAGGAGEQADEERPIAIFHKGLVVAASVAARADGVRRGQRRRDAQARCPSLEAVASDPARDRRLFAPIVSLVETLMPGVEVVRPGLCVLRARGPARYYGGEEAAARVLLHALSREEIAAVRVGIADGPFAAEQVARAPATDAVRIVAPGEAAAFLAALPTTALGDAELAHLLARLGVHTLGAFAALDPDRVRERFGAHGLGLQRLAAGDDPRRVEPRTPTIELHREVVFDPPVELAEQVAFGVRRTAEEFIAGIGALDLVCTELRVELVGEQGERSERVWLHPGSFDATAVVDRVRWQLAESDGGDAGGDREPGGAADAAAPRSASGGAAPLRGGALRSGVVRVRIDPEAVDAASHHRPALFGSGPEERVHHTLSRVQAMLGHRGVLTPAVGGGRWLGERQVLTPWGDRAEATQERARPWPGSVAAPLPATVYRVPRRVEVLSRDGGAVGVDDRGSADGVPVALVAGRTRHDIVAWAGPWPVREREWDAARRRAAYRFQVVDADQRAWLLVCEHDGWSVEGRYD